jgi:hypothetical protein
MKFLAETTGGFMLVDMGTGQTIQASRPSVIDRSPFVDARIALNQVVKIADLSAEATDGEFAEFWRESGERDLAISSFLSKFDASAPAEDAEAPKKRGNK